MDQIFLYNIRYMLSFNYNLCCILVLFICFNLLLYRLKPNSMFYKGRFRRFGLSNNETDISLIESIVTFIKLDFESIFNDNISISVEGE